MSELIKNRDFRTLKTRLRTMTPQSLMELWPALEPLEKAAIFKLLEPSVAMDFYRGLDFAAKYFLFCAAEPGTVAPLTEDLSPVERSYFHKLSEDESDRMFRQLS